jgi:glycosyltransferase involved in cell wall biosynthesis
MLISLVVLTKNNSEELEATLSSIHAQLFNVHFVDPQLLEVIVVDGSVSPKCKEFFEQFDKSSLGLIYLRDFPPQGIYAAMNIGLAATSGDWVLFLNSGDTFFDATALSRLLQCSLDFYERFCFQPIAIFGQALICPQHGSSYKPWLMPDPAVYSIRRWLSIYYPNHQSLLVDGSWARAHPFQLDAPQSADRGMDACSPF